MSFDFIVSGAGSAGCVLAARLSEDPANKVLLLEAGPSDRNPWIHIPGGFSRLYAHPKLNWRFESEPVAALNNRTLYQPRGKVLGGSSSINGTVYIRGTPTDYDQWRQSGCDGWDWESVLPFFKKAENQERGGDALHGDSGPLNVCDLPTPGKLPTALIEAAGQAGIPVNPDFNGPSQEGAGFYQFTAAKHRRWSTAQAYLKPALGRSNLKVETGAHATRILVQGGNATGIEYQVNGELRAARANREVIVSGGAFGSPQLLQLSGIGPAEHLRDIGIRIHKDLPGVGANLQDHFNTYIAFRCNTPETMNDLALSPPRQWLAGVRYVLFKTGMLSNTGVSAGLFTRTDPRFEQPDLQINFAAWGAARREATGVVPYPFSSFSLSPVHLRPEGRGQVRLKSADATAAPAIQYNFLVSEYDKAAIVFGMRLCRHIAAQPALATFIDEEVQPGPQVESDEQLLEDVRARAIANYHPVGTCRMGRQTDAVVDPRLRVHGIGKLRVADASIMPQIVGGNTNAPTIMIAEKAAAMIREDFRSGG